MPRFLLLLAAFLLAAPAAAQFQQSEGEIFLDAVRDGNGGVALPMLQEPGSRVVNYKGFAGEAAIHIVARDKSMAWLRTLIRYGADVNIADREGETPLLIATQLGWVEGAEQLLRANARVDAANGKGETPLIRAVLLRQPRLVRLYMEKGANPDQADYSAGLSARDYARRDNRNPELLQILENTQSETSSTGALQFGPVIELPPRQD